MISDWACMPVFSAFCDDAVRPASVRGPVAFWAFLRFASIWRAVAMGDSPRLESSMTGGGKRLGILHVTEANGNRVGRSTNRGRGCPKLRSDCQLAPDIGSVVAPRYFVIRRKRVFSFPFRAIAVGRPWRKVPSLWRDP